MPIEPKPPTAKGPSDWFTGDVYIDPVVRATGSSRVNVSAVRFTPGARTAWPRTPSARRSWSPTDSAYTSLAVALSSRSAQVTSSSHLLMSGTGTAPPQTTT